MIDKLSSEENQPGDTFHGSLDEPIQINGRELYPKGADVIGRVTDVRPTGRLSEPGELDLVLNTITAGRVAASINVEPLVVKGESHAKSNATKIGGGAALGAVIGAIAGGGKGAAIGTVAGGAAGTGAAAATGKKPALVDPEAVLTFVTASASNPSAPQTARPNGVSPPSQRREQPAPRRPPVPPPGARETPLPDSDRLRLQTTQTTDECLHPARPPNYSRKCVNDNSSDLPQAAVQRPELPSGRRTIFIVAALCRLKFRIRRRRCL